MKKALLALGLFVTLGGCPGPQPMTNNTATPLPLPTGTATPMPWLTSDPECTGTLTRAEWLVCDNKGLNDLHRRLAQEWQVARQNASPEREQVLTDQLYALLSERDACQDATCVATAYRRYLSGPPPRATPAPSTWKPKPKPRPKPRWHPRPGHDRGGDGDWQEDRDGPVKGQSCVAQAGPGPAQQLSRQCDAVNSGPGALCSPRRSCGDLREQITHGCRQSYRKPGFCRL
ncbi:MAG: hypothetical protein V4574_14340 [Pseudomonadota bacterium]